MGVYIRGPHLGPVRTTLYSSSGRKSGSGGGCLGVFLGLALLGGAFGVSPVLGWLVFAAIPVTAIVLLYRYLRPARPAKPAQPAKPAKPEGPRDWQPGA